MAPADPITDCPTWPISYAECDTLGPEACWTPNAKATFEQMAVDYLWNWTAGRFGLCSVLIRPCRSNCWPASDWPYYSTWEPVLVGGQWFNLSCGWCGDLCSCATSAATNLKLPGPIDSITKILIDGVPLVTTAYRVDNGVLLQREDGDGWPVCQDLALPADAVGTWSIEYVRGVPVPAGGQVAAGVLAVELAKYACGDSSCQLPKRVQSITRQGVTVALLDSFDDVDKGRTGVWLIDSWVASVMNRPRGATVRSVDVPHPRHRVTTGAPAPVNPV